MWFLPQPAALFRRLNLEEAIKVIQVAERARQGRLRAKFMKEIQKDKERQKKAKDRDWGEAARNTAATSIQKVYNTSLPLIQLYSSICG